jgi:alpha-1,6-mannosyltransferase
MQKKSPRASSVPTFILLGLAGGLAAIFNDLGRQRHLEARVPEFIALSLLAGILYLIGVYWVERFSLGPAAFAIVLLGAVVFRLLVLPAPPSLSEDVYRYQWQGRVERAGLNPYAVFPAMPELAWLEDPQHPVKAGRTTPSLYPPLSEKAFSWVRTIQGYKRLFTALDLASLGILLLLLAALKQPLHRVLAYAWNPTVVVAFALCGHHDSLAIVTLLSANIFIIGQRPALSIVSLALSVLSKLFPAGLLPLFLKRTRWVYAGIFLALVTLAYLPYLGEGRNLFQGLSDYARGWEANDSLFRLIRWAGNSKAQAELVAGALVLGLVLYALQKGIEPLRASLIFTVGLLLLSPDAFPWYFTWSIPFLCFYPNLPWLLMSVTCVLGYAPVVAYAAGQPYRDSPFILALEYVPVFLWLGYEARRTLKVHGS